MSRFTVRRGLLAIMALTSVCGVSMPAFASREKPSIGFSIDDLRVARWKRDRDYFIEAAKNLGADVSVVSADGDAAKQVAQIESLIAAKIDVLVIAPKDQSALVNVIKNAKKAGIKVVSYDRLIKSSDVDAHITFDNERVGYMQGEALYNAVPKGDYFILTGDPGDNNAKLIRNGALRALEPAIKKGDIRILGEQAVKDWLPANALPIVENAMSKYGNKIDAFVAPNDSIAGTIILPLSALKLARKVAVGGQDAELAACKRVLAGTQVMTVYKPLKLIASEAAKLAVALVRGDKVTYNPEKAENSVPQILLDPIAITKSNMDILVKDQFYTKEQLGI